MTKRAAYFWAAIIILLIFGVSMLVFRSLQWKEIMPAQVIQPGYYKVVEVHDGDTISVNMNGTVERVRMIGVDTPETHKPNTPVQCYGPEASDHTKKLLDDKNVRLEADPTNSNRDRYDRLLRYVYTEQGELVDKSLIEQGYGFAYLSFPFEKSDEFSAAQEQAEVEKRGLWLSCQPTLKGGRWSSDTL